MEGKKLNCHQSVCSNIWQIDCFSHNPGLPICYNERREDLICVWIRKSLPRVDVSPHKHIPTLIYHQKGGLDEDILAAYSFSPNPQLKGWSSLNPQSTFSVFILKPLILDLVRRWIQLRHSHLPDLLTKYSLEAGLMSNSVLCSYTILYTVGTYKISWKWMIPFEELLSNLLLEELQIIDEGLSHCHQGLESLTIIITF